jgi:TonB-dependent starch-binding outer membrane protein SusC
MKNNATQIFLRSGQLMSFAKFLLVGIFLISQLGAAAQTRTITGNITGDDGSPLPGVTIVLKGTTTGTISDADGNYTLPNVPTDATIVFSFVGMKTQEVVVGNQTTINVSLQTDAIGLEEVIAVGYGTMRKSDLTGSVARVSFEDKSLQSNLNILQTLSGASAGINVQQTGGAGEEPDFSIRGKTSLSASDKPLIVLDGIIYNGAVADINVSDVKSVDVLKDASAAAVYGSRSANGVILITTKQGNSEKPQINFNCLSALVKLV